MVGLNMNKNLIKEKIAKIKLVATDIDGVWTDAKMYYSPNGDFMKAFSAYDGMAVSLLKEKNIEVMILTGEKTKMVKKRAEKLKIKHCYQGEKDKLSRLKKVCKIMKISLKNVAFIGDDLNDLEALKSVGLSALTANSPILQKFVPDFITTREGGNGAFREFADLILKFR